MTCIKKEGWVDMDMRKILIVLCLAISCLLGFFGWHRAKRHQGVVDVHKLENVQNIVPVCVIGSGPAGASAAMYTSRARIPSLVISGSKVGGQLSQIQSIENMPGKQRSSGKDLSEDLWNQARYFGARMITDKVTDIDVSQWPCTVKTEQGYTIRPLTTIIATGRVARRLPVEGVEEYWGKGLGDCTICEAPFHKGHTVAVIGGGDTAGDRAMQLAVYAKKVYMLVKDSRLDASGAVQEYIADTKNIEIVYNTELMGIYGDGNVVTGMKVENLTNGKQGTIPVDGIYFAIGYIPVTGLFKGKLDLDSEGYIVLKEGTQATSVRGIFAGGDVVDKRYGKAGIATGSGIKAALDALEFLQEHGLSQDKIKALRKNFFTVKQTSATEHIELLANRPALDNIIASGKGTVILDIYSESCPVCTFLLSQLEQLAQKHKQAVTVIKANKDQFKEITSIFGVTTVPTFVVFKDGVILEKTNAIKTPKQLQEFVAKYAQQ
jgi:thioredoxin reductase (NADPH)